MRDYAKEVAHKGHIDGLDVIPFFQHEMLMRREASKEKKLILATAAAVLIASNLAWIIITRKH
jgi:hypothetical protein